jgi:hypothetical protein
MITEFSMKWDTKVKELANKCVNWEFIKLTQKGENNILSEEEEKMFQELGNNIKDPYGMWYISDMIWQVEHSLMDNKEPLAKLAIAQVYNVISRESYWTNIFNNDLSLDEAKNIKALQECLKEFM